MNESKLNFIENVDELPDYCYGVLPSDNTIIIIEKGESGYHPTTGYNDLVTGESWDERSKSADKVVKELNDEIGVTPDQIFTMEIRSMNGNWKSKSTENKKLKEEITDDAHKAAEEIAEEIEKVGIMNFQEIQDKTMEILGIDFDSDLKDEDIYDIFSYVYECLNYMGIANNWGDGDFYTEEYAKEHPEVLEESKTIKTEKMKSKRPLADIRMAIPFAYGDLLEILENGIKNNLMSEEEVSDAIKSINTNWDDEDVAMIINDYKNNYMNVKELSDDEKSENIQNTMVRDWYIENYPDDELGTDIREGLSFYDLYETLDNYMNVYTVLGVDDSIVRERVFDKLSELMDVDYDYIYQQWLQTKDETTEEEVVEFLKQSHPKTEDKKASGVKGKITEVEEDLEDNEEDEPNELEDLIQSYKDKSPMHEAIIDEFLDDIDEYDGETKLEKVIGKMQDITGGAINDGTIKGLIAFSDTDEFYRTYEYDIEDVIEYMQDAGLEPLETLKMNCDDTEIIMQTSSAKYWIVCMIYSEIAYQFQNDLENLKGE